MIDICHLLPTIHVPTLVLHRTGDKIVPLEAVRSLRKKLGERATAIETVTG